MALLFPNSVEVVISLIRGLTRSNSSVCFLRGRRSCPPVGLWGGDELESPQCASLVQVVSVMGMGVRCMEMSMVGSCCAAGKAWLETVCGWVPFAEDEHRHFRGDLTAEGGSMSS